MLFGSGRQTEQDNRRHTLRPRLRLHSPQPAVRIPLVVLSVLLLFGTTAAFSTGTTSTQKRLLPGRVAQAAVGLPQQHAVFNHRNLLYPVSSRQHATVLQSHNGCDAQSPRVSVLVVDESGNSICYGLVLSVLFFLILHLMMSFACA